MWSTPHPARHIFVTVLSPNPQQFLPLLAVVTHLLFDFSLSEHAPSCRSCTLSALPPLPVDGHSHPFRIRSDVSTMYVRSPPSHRDTTTRFDPALGESYHRPLPQLADPLSGIPCDHVCSEFHAASTFRAPFSCLHRCFSVAPTIGAVANIKIHISVGELQAAQSSPFKSGISSPAFARRSPAPLVGSPRNIPPPCSSSLASHPPFQPPPPPPAHTFQPGFQSATGYGNARMETP